MDLLNKIAGSEKIIIYGAGLYARLVVSYLYVFELEQKLIGVTTTKADGTELFLTRSVLPLDFFSGEGTALVIVAISPGKTEGIKDRLERYGFHNRYFMSEEDVKAVKASFATLPIQPNKLFVDCYDGMGYRCNCKYVAKYILEHKYPIEIVWRRRNQYKCEFPDGIREIDVDSPFYFRELYSSGLILTNVVFNKVRTEQYAIWMWHGTGPFKKAGAAAFEKTAENDKMLRKAYSGIDLYVSNSRDNSEMYRNDFYYEGETAEWGYPRNDIFFRKNNIRERMREKFNIGQDQNVLLYVPTFREDIASSFRKYDLNIPSILNSLKKRFGKEFVFAFRYHHWLYDELKNTSARQEGLDVTLYEDTQELLLMADVLITDYSSIMWDFSLMRKPVFLYHNDDRQYDADRGFYWSPERWPYPKAHSTDEMCGIIEGFNDEDYQRRLDAFFEEDPSYDDGRAAERVVGRIMDVLNHPDRYQRTPV